MTLPDVPFGQKSIYSSIPNEQQRYMNRLVITRSDIPVSYSDIIRFVIIALLSVMIAIVTAFAVPGNPAAMATQLFYIPILYSAYFYPKLGLYVAGGCAGVYEILGSIAAYPDPFTAALVIALGVLFVVAAAIVSHLSETIRAANARNRELEERILQDNERRRGVITTVAHELRTPLQPIMGYLNLLLQDPKEYGLDDGTQKILSRCLTSVEREREIINRMLEFSVLESGKLRLEYSVFSVQDLVASLVSSGGYAAQAEIAVEIPHDLKFQADAGRIGIAIDSVLSNAIAYSRPPRLIRISYLCRHGTGCHELAIRDNGVGIPADRLDTIFEPFQLADADKLSRKYDRIGLSLSIAQKYLRMHGGFISVNSVVNEGSTFTLHIPTERRAGEDFA